MKTLALNFNGLYAKANECLAKKIDLSLLFFLLFMTNYRILFKLIAIVGICIYRPDFKIKRNGVFYFYASMILLGIFNLLFINRDYSFAHLLIIFTGCFFWIVSLLSFHQVSISVEKNDSEKTISTLKALALLNFIASAFDFIKVVIATKSINPYTDLSPPPYGISSGDFIGGVYGNLHLVNMICCFFLIIFFIYKKQFLYSLLSFIPFLLTGSNFGTIILFLSLLYMLILKKDILCRYFSLGLIAILCVFYVKVTPFNFDYMQSTLRKIGSQLGIKTHTPSETTEVKKNINYFDLYIKSFPLKDTMEKRKVKFEEIKKVSDQKRVDYVYYKKDSIQKQKMTDPFFNQGNLQKFDFDQESGKITSFKQTFRFMLSNPSHLLFGAGIGSFSSKLAFVTSDVLDDSRILMLLPKFENPDFVQNHKAIYKYSIFLNEDAHSITNRPFSIYNQLLGEYGIIGLLSFLGLYIGYFLRTVLKPGYGKILVGSLFLFCMFDYWFESLSILIIFELLMLLELKINSQKKEVL